mmetsp:Transcript_49934/g.116592  ORF Transcript_49934/g.116592 Transcript_49934/m.116592 type:complete len:362 (-) Transcript_49934:60-1145(-)
MESSSAKRWKRQIFDPPWPAEATFNALFRADDFFVKGAVTPCFNWQQVSVKFGTILQAIVAGAIYDYEEPQRIFDKRLELIPWCISRGADPDQHAPEKVQCKVPVDNLDLPLAGNSAQSILSTVLCIYQQELLSDMDPLSILPHRLKMMQKLLLTSERPKLRLVVESIATHVWEEVSSEPEFADVAVLSMAMPPNGMRCRFPAHSVILCQASPVFDAMLKHKGWRESDSFQITLEESPDVLRIFLMMLCSGVLPMLDGKDVRDLVRVAEMADKYQVEFLVPVLLAHFRQNITIPTFASICDFGLKYKQSGLLADCSKFVGEKARAGDINPEFRWPGATHETMNFIVDTLNLYAHEVAKRTL